MKIQINPGARRMFCLVGSIIFGGIFPVIAPATRDFFNNDAGCFVPPMIVTMLLFSFIDVKFSRKSVGLSHLRILIFMAAFATTTYFAAGAIAHKFESEYAQDFAVMAFLIGMAPTATAAPVITNLLGRREDYATISVVLSNLFVAFTLAPLVDLVMGRSIEIDTSALALKTILLIGIPFSTAMLFRKFSQPATTFIRQHKYISFYLWMATLFIVCAQSSTYICTQKNLSPRVIASIFLLAATMCTVNFVTGYFLGERHFRRECSQSLGQKNTMLMLWVGLAFFNPIVALGPTFYIVCHNLWNSWQLRRADKNASTIR